jgi:hypothetical protein
MSGIRDLIEEGGRRIRRLANPRRKKKSKKWDRCVKAVSKKDGANPYAVCTARVKNPRKLTKSAQRRQAKSLLDWASKVLHAPDMKFPGGRMSHDVARDQIALVRQKYATNPRKVLYLIEAHKGKQKLYYAAGSKFDSRGKAKAFDSRNDARTMAVQLKAAFETTLKGWALRVVTA